MNMEKRIADLEMRFSFQDQLISQLDEVITRQQAQIDHLEKMVALMADRHQSSGSLFEAIEGEEPPPPHY